MYHDKEQLATLLFEGLDDYILENASINELLTPQQKYQLIMRVINILPATDHEKVIEFNQTFGVEKETTFDVAQFKYGVLRFSLLLEEVLELGTALGMSRGAMYELYVKIQEKVASKGIEPGITEVLDALTDISYVNYGALHVFNLDDITWAAMENVHDSNMSKIIPLGIGDTAFKEIIKELTADGTSILATSADKGIVIRNKDTGKVLKPATYTPATLGNLLKSYLQDRTKSED